MVGESVGVLVGESVGESVGDLVGDLVGESVGDLVGVSVGVSDGAFDGTAVGFTVGLAVGSVVGSTIEVAGVDDQTRSLSWPHPDFLAQPASNSSLLQSLAPALLHHQLAAAKDFPKVVVGHCGLPGIANLDPPHTLQPSYDL